MNIDCYTVAYNEEKMIGFFLEHYSKFCRNITVFDNYSTDSTADIVNQYNNKNIFIEQFDSGNTINDSIYLQIKNNCWKNSDADYVIIVDCDEILYHPNIISFLESTKRPIYKPYGFDMVSDIFPEKGKSIVEQITEGVISPLYSKMCIFSPIHVREINYQLGCHVAWPSLHQGEYISSHVDDDLKLLHYKNLSFEYRFNRHENYGKRLSDFNLATRSGMHILNDKEVQYSEFLTFYNNRSKII